MFLPFWCLSFDVATAILTVVVCDSIIMGITKKIIAKQLRLVFGDERVNIFASIYCRSHCELRLCFVAHCES